MANRLLQSIRFLYFIGIIYCIFLINNKYSLFEQISAIFVSVPSAKKVKEIAKVAAMHYNIN